MKQMIVMFLSVMILLICTVSMATGFAETSVAANAARVENATIDSSVYLDYAAGIQAGVYRWFLSEDGSYYTLAAADENGEPITGQETAINVGANNEERRGMMGGAGRNGQMPQGSQGDFGGNPPQDFGGDARSWRPYEQRRHRLPGRVHERQYHQPELSDHAGVCAGHLSDDR